MRICQLLAILVFLFICEAACNYMLFFLTHKLPIFLSFDYKLKLHRMRNFWCVFLPTGRSIERVTPNLCRRASMPICAHTLFSRLVKL